MLRVSHATPHWTTSDGELVRLYHGDVLQTLRRLPSKAVQCIVTSPPYWGLRDYSICNCRPKPAEIREPSSTLNPGGGNMMAANFGKPLPDCPICLGTGFDLSMTYWLGGVEGCNHTKPSLSIDLLDRGSSTLGGGVSTQNVAKFANGYKDVCGKCGAKRVNAQLGSERIPDCLAWARGQNCADESRGGNWITGCHICRMILVFREARRVLRDDGVCWVNYGDTYSASTVNNNNGVGSKVIDATDQCNVARKEMTKTLNDQRKLCDIGLEDGNLIGVPWRFAFSMQADGWILRSDLPWVKRNPMPESAVSRPGKSLEYVFMFTKGMDYFFDMDAVKPKSSTTWNSHQQFVEAGPRKKLPPTEAAQQAQRTQFSHNTQHPNVDQNERNFRNADLWFSSVDAPHGMVGWGDSQDMAGLDVHCHPYGGAHYACYPPKLIEPLIKCSTSDAGCCADCGTPWQRVKTPASGGAIGAAWLDHSDDAEKGGFKTSSSAGYRPGVTMYWEPACSCHGRDAIAQRVPCRVLDPFMGSGTTAQVCIELGRRAWGIEISKRYIDDHQIERVTKALSDKPSLHDQIVERPRKVYAAQAVPIPLRKAFRHGQSGADHRGRTSNGGQTTMNVEPYDGRLATGTDEDGHVVYTDDLDGFAECISERATGADAADAAELVRRWNAFPGLLAACRDALNCLAEGDRTKWQHPESPYHWLYVAIAAAEGNPCLSSEEDSDGPAR